MIRIPQVRVVDEDGSQLGVMPTAQALAMAQERGYDLVEVAPMAAPPVVRFLDFGQFKYEATKREKEAKRKQRSVTFKEVRLKPKIATGDFDTRVRRAIQFLEEGDRLKVAVQFRGRELTHPEIGRNLLARFSERIKDHGVVERAPLLEGKSMHITVASTHKPKVIEAPKHDEGGSAAPGEDSALPDGPAPAPALPAAAAAEAPVVPVAAEAPVAPAVAPATTAAATTAAAAPAEAAAIKAPARPAAVRVKAVTTTETTAATPAAPPATKPAPKQATKPALKTTTKTASPASAVRAAPKRAPRTTRAAEPEAKAAATSAAKSSATTGE
jgi:translation initiation factor IF-3